MDGSDTLASCHLCYLRPLTVIMLQVEPVMRQDESTGGHVFTHAIARLVHDLAEMPDLLLMRGVFTSVHAW